MIDISFESESSKHIIEANGGREILQMTLFRVKEIITIQNSAIITTKLNQIQLCTAQTFFLRSPQLSIAIFIMCAMKKRKIKEKEYNKVMQSNDMFV